MESVTAMNLIFRNHYFYFKAYSQSKLSQLLFSNYLNSLLKTEGMFVRSYAVHPGIVNTDIFRGTLVKNYQSWIISLMFKVSFTALKIVERSEIQYATKSRRSSIKSENLKHKRYYNLVHSFFVKPLKLFSIG